MVARVVRMLVGYVLASLAAGLSIVLFVYTPAELVSDFSFDRLREMIVVALAAGTYTAFFSSPFAVIGMVFAEWRSIVSWTYFTLVGIAIAVIGFAVQSASESGGAETIVNTYALTAFLVTGCVGGLVYWYLSGRWAGSSDAPSRVAPAPEKPALVVNNPGGPSESTSTSKA